MALCPSVIKMRFYHIWTTQSTRKSLFVSKFPMFLTRLGHSRGANDLETVQPLSVTSLPKKRNPSTSSMNKAISSRHRKRKNLASSQWSDETDRLRLEEENQNERLAYTISKYSSKHDAQQEEYETIRDMIKKINFVRAKTIENKYFRKKSPPNLLTYSTKEQIRYLHHKDPDTWSVEQLIESFPVCVENIKQILKDRRRLHRPEDILQHDEVVQKNWQCLKASLNGEKNITFDEAVYKGLINSKDENLIANADGIKCLPMPAQKTKSFKPRGPFSAIVSDCCELKEQKKMFDDKTLHDKCQQLSTLLSDTSEVLDNIMGRSYSKSRLQDSAGTKTKKSNYAQMEGKIKSENSDNDLHLQDEAFLECRRKYKETHSGRDASDTLSPVKLQGTVKEKISVHHEGLRQCNTQTYVHGNCIYDHNGELLYKIP